MFLKRLFLKKNVEIDDNNILSIFYKGYSVFYSKGTSLVERIKKYGDYEPEVTASILNELKLVNNPQIIDVGANIGLISLAILSNKSNARIYAFEPGPHQNALLQKTVKENGLVEKINVFNLALSDKKGEAKFKIHNTNDASGDGFVDTKRAGPTQSIIVKTDTLDNWWVDNNKPHIDFIKMDTERSEYLILKGASDLNKSLRPKILIEINLMNLKNYPFSLKDLLSIIVSYNYQIFSLGREPINITDIDKYLMLTDTFLLIPN